MSITLPNVDFFAFERNTNLYLDKNVYIFAGDEPYFQDKAVSIIVSRLKLPQNSIVKFDAKEVEPHIITGELFTDSIFEKALSKKIIVLANGNDFLKEETISQFKSIAKSPDNVLVILDSKVESSSVQDLSKIHAIKTLFITCDKMPDYKLPAWVQGRASEIGRPVNSEVAILISREIGNNLFLIDEELKKIVSFSQERNSISREDVNSVIVEVGNDNVFEITDRIDANDLAGACKVLEELVASGVTPQEIMIVLMWYYRRFLYGKLLIKELPTDKLMDRLKVQYRKREAFLKTISSLSFSEVLEKLVILRDFEKILKSEKVPDDVVIEILLAKLFHSHGKKKVC